MADPIVHAIQPDYNYGPIVAICGLPFYGSNACMNVFAGQPVTCPGCLAVRQAATLTRERDEARAAYEIEGGPESIQSLSRCPDCGGPRTDMDEHDAWCDDCWGKRCQPAEDSPERLRERREALGLSKNDARLLIGNSWTTAHISDCEDVDPSRSTAWAGPRAVYADALSAEEARLAAKVEPERPAPRFKVGDWVRVAQPHSRYYGHVYQVAEIEDGWHRKAVGSPQCSHWIDGLEPASPPAPEVVDVPQPIVKRCACPDIHDAVEATWRPGEPYLTVTHTTIPLALLRAMLEAIDAQQGGAS